MKTERLQKILSQAGFGSRRSCEELIVLKRVTVNGAPVELGMKADPEKDNIKIDGKLIPKKKPGNIYIAFNKKIGVRSDTDPVPVEGHLYPVGRLDIDAEGLILLTDDGDLANRLTHPRYGHEKEYQVLVSGRPDQKQLAAWRRGVILEEGIRTLPARVYIQKQNEDTTWLKIIMREGRKRQIKEVGKTIGLPVKRIIRTRLSTLELGSLKPGEWRYLTKDEIRDLSGSVVAEKEITKIKK
jgi:23S rRNA pseudouridine2605 synthase